MADDIVQRLRINADAIDWEQPLAAERQREAAAEIERLCALVNELQSEIDGLHLSIRLLSAELTHTRDAGNELAHAPEFPMKAYLQWREDGASWAATALDDYTKRRNAVLNKWKDLQ